MTPQGAARLAWSLCALTGALLAASLALPVLNGFDLEALLLDWTLANGTSSLGFAVVGAIIASRRPGNAIGWLFCAFATGAALGQLARQYAHTALVVDPGSLPGGEWAAWLLAWIIQVNFGTLALVFLLFPDGRALSRRWGAFLRLAAVTVGFTALTVALSPLDASADFPFSFARNPLAVLPSGVASAALGVLQNLVLLTWVAAGACLYLRLRHGSPVQRRQVKWFVSAAVLGITVFLAIASFSIRLTGLGALLAFPPIPMAAAVAILRYRLYEIDRIVSRTVTYAVVTVVLAGVYAIVAVLPSAVLDLQSDLLVAAATLAAAAAFGPVRRRVQVTVDRRFNRFRYDAQRTVAAFSVRVRDEVDLAGLQAYLLAAVGSTVQPAHTSIWLRGAAR